MADTLYPLSCSPRDGVSNTTVSALRTTALHAPSMHYMQPRPLTIRQQMGTGFGAQPLLPWSDRLARSCLARPMLQSDCNEDPALAVRYQGVSSPSDRRSHRTSIYSQGKSYFLGSYATPAEAACVYDKACIFLKRDPVNFPRSQYDEAAIHQISDLDTFAKCQRLESKRTLPKRGAFSRFFGVSRSGGGKDGKWTSHFQVMGQRHSLGVYTTEELAAQACDKVRIYQNLGATNFPEASYDVESIHQQESVGSLIASIRAEATALTKARQISRFFGVYRWQNTNWISQCIAEGQRHCLGIYPTEELAAQAYDKVRIYQGLGVRNFPDASYDVESIQQQESISSLAASIKAEASALTKARQRSRYTGVTSAGRGVYHAFISSSNAFLGSYKDEEQAAMAYDRFCIYQGHAPVNVPGYPYDTQEIRRPADLTEFIHQSRERAARLTKERQTSRYTGVSWDTRVGMWATYTHQGGKKVHIAWCASEEEAALLVDEERKKVGQQTVNLPLKSRHTPIGKAWSDLPRKQAKT